WGLVLMNRDGNVTREAGSMARAAGSVASEMSNPSLRQSDVIAAAILSSASAVFSSDLKRPSEAPVKNPSGPFTKPASAMSCSARRESNGYRTIAVSTTGPHCDDGDIRKSDGTI